MNETVDPLAAAIETIISQLDEQTAERIKNASDDDISLMHFGLGMAIRNSLGLWAESPLHDFFTAKGVRDADDMSHAVILALRAHLQGKDPLAAVEQGNKP